MKSLNPTWGWAIALLLAAAASVMFFLSHKAVYEAQAAIEVEAVRPLDALQIVQSSNVILQAAGKAGLNTAPEFNAAAGSAALLAALKSHLSVHYEESSHLLRIAFRAPDPRQAADFANALIDAFADEARSRHLSEAADRTTQIDQLEGSIQVLETQLTEFNQAPGAIRPEALLSQVNQQKERYDGLVQKASEPMPRGIIHRAAIPTEAVDAAQWKGFAVGIPMSLFGGLLFFFSLGRFRKLNDSTPAAPQRVPVDEIARPVVALANAGTGFTNPETLFDYVENLLGSGHSVLIVDCELSGTLSDSVGLRGERGLSDLLLESRRVRPLPVWSTNRERVSILPAGTQPNRISSLLTTPRLRRVLENLLTEFDRIVINAPPVLTTGEMRDLCPLVDGVILVAAKERSSGLANLAALAVEESGGRVIGLVEDPHQLAML